MKSEKKIPRQNLAVLPTLLKKGEFKKNCIVSKSIKKVFFVFGTRPEAIKMLPLIKVLEKNNKLKSIICVTGQHRQMLDSVLKIFKIKPHYDLNLMKKGQTLIDITIEIFKLLPPILEKEKPDIVLVQGDTTSSFVASLCAFYANIKVGHIEAGLRTYDLKNPFPEEANRRFNSVIANFHFAPTKQSAQNLIEEKIPKETVFLTGNTVIDALNLALKKIDEDKTLKKDIVKKFKDFDINSKFILITGHRRENFGEGFLNLCNAIQILAKEHKNINFIYPVHLNPNVQKPVYKILSKTKNIYLIEPLEYLPFVFLMSKSYVILTDSGGVQEEAPSLGKPVLVFRKTSERMEAVESGVVKIIGVEKENIVKEVNFLLKNTRAYEKMSKKENPYGDGKASKRIVEVLSKVL